jgi:hypothetical protein
MADAVDQHGIATLGQIGQCQIALIAGQAWQAYLHALKRRPLLVKSASALVCAMVGDSIAQALMPMPYSIARTLQLGAYSATVNAPASHHWNLLLDSKVWPKRPKAGATVAGKVVLDQLLFTPAMTAAWLCFVALALEGQAVVPFLEAKLVPTLLAGWSFWPAVCVFSFRCVPRDLRVLFGSCLGIVWGTYLSLTTCSRGG